MEYTVVLTEDEVRFLRKITQMAATSIPPEEFTQWVIDELGSENVKHFYNTFMKP